MVSGKLSHVLIAGSLIAVFGFQSISQAAQTTSSRKAARAGKDYPKDGSALYSELNLWYAKTQPIVQDKNARKLTKHNTPMHGNVLAMIVPHGKLQWTGWAQARAFKALGSRRISRVILLGPSHTYPFRGAVVPSYTSFRTPLGKLNVDRAAVEQLKSTGWFHVNDQIHRKELSIEDQLPFVYRAFGPNVKIIPVIVGDCKTEPEARAIAQALRRVMVEDDLVIDTTNFSTPKHVARARNKLKTLKKDRNFYIAVQRHDPATLYRIFNKSHNHLCGFGSLAVLMELLPPNATATLLDYYRYEWYGKQHSANFADYNGESMMAVVFTGGFWR